MTFDPAVPDWARRPAPQRRAGASPRIAIVGACASGKSTLAAALAADGYEPQMPAQEHSDVPHLWALSEPDAVIFLAVSLTSLRQRRDNPTWSAAIYQRQLQRLDQARTHATIIIDTDARSPAEVHRAALTGLTTAGVLPAKEPRAPHGNA